MILTEEHEAIRATIAQFIDKEINPYADQWEEEGIFPAHELFKKMGNLGLLGISKPEEFGGMGLDYSYQVVFAEELGRIRTGGVGMAIGVQTDMATPALAKHGSDELRRQFLMPAIAGDMVCSIAVSEPHAGSDVAAIKTTAKKNGDDYIIQGTKMWITNSTQADFICLLANTSDEGRHANKSLIVVPMNLPGISLSEKLNKLGQRSSDTAQIFFDDVRVPQRYLIGQEGAGFRYQMEQFQEERLYAMASNLKMMEFVIDDTIEYTRQRQAFGKSILDNQVVHFRLAELQTEVECLRALTYAAVEGYINGQDVTLKASMGKLKAGRLLREVTDSCLQYWGGMGYMWDSSVARAYRDGRLGSIGGGADEVMLGIIAKHMGILPKRQ
ncbi:MAG: acyl-CoA dehydrogenase [SAR92 bacterium BACL26 MAG-121220-bin70]|jgi:citronellyl-CoA dehydrogenase|uniref:Acyl-CoA dehydrogenase n=1 Tax=SAR92 bacterium BACL26 MAG-121220-bin70 TaxID=1655626 RepID=A0A0R2U9N0_9GAMM|nr:MAG: acyl-CoA dehydrogenase [SAR92 bacterium BACL26 MAG-121220-bin70]|tara:strand:- start:16126 stop:17280 length:1155 start_codon:yes stop_codon:yes gene_type:complete